MSENNLKILGDELRTYDDNCICSLYDYDCVSEETVKLLQLAYELYKKAHSSSNVQVRKSKYMKLC